MSTQISESDPLLPRAEPQSATRWKRPHPRWLVPLALLSSLARGLTLAARVQIITRISCDALYRANEATLEPSLPLPGSALASANTIPATCFSDPAVQASAAQVQMLLMVISGGATALTAGRWGKWGDKSGRNKVMSVALLGLVLA
jgi:hypothetical protein